MGLAAADLDGGLAGLRVCCLQQPAHQLGGLLLLVLVGLRGALQLDCPAFHRLAAVDLAQRSLRQGVDLVGQRRQRRGGVERLGLDEVGDGLALQVVRRVLVVLLDDLGRGDHVRPDEALHVRDQRGQISQALAEAQHRAAELGLLELHHRALDCLVSGCLQLGRPLRAEHDRLGPDQLLVRGLGLFCLNHHKAVNLLELGGDVGQEGVRGLGDLGGKTTANRGRLPDLRLAQLRDLGDLCLERIIGEVLIMPAVRQLLLGQLEVLAEEHHRRRAVAEVQVALLVGCVCCTSCSNFCVKLWHCISGRRR